MHNQVRHQYINKTTHTKTYKILINYKMNSPKILHYKAEKFTKIRIKTNILLKKTVNKFLLIFLFLGIS